MRWKPISEYHKRNRDWVLVQFKEKACDFYPIPVVAELRKNGEWWCRTDDLILNNYLNDMCEAVAFIDIPPYKAK